jgi:glycosyltransferase involved in cell wall biosynthesis
MSLAHTLGSAVNGGAQAYFVSLVGAFAHSGLKQTVALRAHAGREAAMARFGVPVRVLPFGKTFDFTTSPAIAAMARESDARIILAWMNRAASMTPEGAWKRIGRLGGYYKLKNYRGFDALVGNTQDIVDWIVRQGWPKERACCIPNFAAAAGAGEKIDRAMLDTPAEAPLLLGMGRLHVSKAHDVSLRALALMPDAYLWIAGDGPEEVALKEQAETLGVADRVRFLGWRDDASALYRSADVCVFPSRFEPLGNVVIQAWAHGVPIVAARSAGPGALIHDGEDGALIDIDNAEALAERTRSLLADASLRASFIAAGATRVETEFSEGAIVAQWKALFDRLGGL